MQQLPPQDGPHPAQAWPYDPQGYQHMKKVPHADVSQLVDAEDYRRAAVTNEKGRPKANYKPVSLRWWYITFLILVCLGLAGFVIYLERTLQRTDNTAVIETRSMSHDEAWAMFEARMDELLPRQDSAPTDAEPGQGSGDGTSPTETDGGGGDSNRGGAPPETIEGQLTTAWLEVPFTTMITEPGSTTLVTTFTTTTVTEDVTTEIETTIPGSSTPIVETIDGTTEAAQTITRTESEVIPTTDPDSGEASSYTSFSTITETIGGGVTPPQETTRYELAPPVTTKILTTYPAGGIKTVPVVQTKTGPPIIYASTGRTTIYSSFTADKNGKPIEGPVTRMQTSEIPGHETTIVETPAPRVYTTYGPDGLPTVVTETFGPTTRTTSVPPTRTVITTTSTPTGDAERFVVVSATTYTLTSAGNYLGKFLPPLLAVLLALAVRAVDQTAKLYQPFAALSHARGAAGRDSLTLHFEGWRGFWRPFGLAGQGHPVPLLSTLAVWVANVLAPVASEAVGLKVHGRCAAGAIEGCALSLGVSRAMAYALAGMLVAVALLLAGVLFVTSTRWKTGVFADPWCVAGAAALARNPDVRPVGAPDFAAVKAALAEKQFTLGWYRNAHGREEYGLVLCDEEGRSLRGARLEEEVDAVMRETAYAEAMYAYRPHGPVATGTRPPARFAALTYAWRGAFLAYLAALLGVVLFYHWGKHVPGGLKRFMEGRGFGARFVSSALGVIVILCWECVFCSIVIIAPYRRMANKPQPASRSVLAGRPTYAVTGVFSGLRAGDWLLSLSSLMAVLSDFLPMLLANVPYNLTQTEDVHTVCARLSAGLLAAMAVALLATLFVRWPVMPVDPRSVAGEMWYVAEARWTERLEGAASLTDRERRERLREMRARWSYGMVGTRMGDRMGVELHDVYGETAYY